MRKRLVIATTAGALGLTGLAVAVPALADDATAAASSSVDRIRDALADLVTDGSLTEEQADEVATTLSESGRGGHGGHHGGGMDLSAAATALGLSDADIRTALEAEDATLATVAEDQGVSVDVLVTALTEAAQERIAQAVGDGRLTQEQADERLLDLEQRITERVNSTDLHGPRGGRGASSDGTSGSTPAENSGD